MIVGVAGSLGFWQGLAAVSQDRSQVRGKTASEKKSIPPTESSAKPKAPATGPPYRLSGVVRVEGTGEPVPGVKLRIRLRDAAADALENPQLVVTGRDGRFSAEMGPGNAIFFLSEPPPGYWIPTNQKITESFVFGPNQPVVDREYHVRKGTDLEHPIHPWRGGVAAVRDTSLARTVLGRSWPPLTMTDEPD